MYASMLKDADLYFIHIPKNAGTAFQKQLCKSIVGHIPASNIPDHILSKSVAIVRNPYSRLYSIYCYSKLEKSYWHSNDGTTQFTLHPLFHFTTRSTFEEFVIAVCKHNRFPSDIHLLPQHRWIQKNGSIRSIILKMETLNRDISTLLKKEIKLSRVNVAVDDANEYKKHYTQELADMVYMKYEDDFVLFGYDRNIS